MRSIKQILCKHDLQIRYILPYIKENKISVSFHCKKCSYIFNHVFMQEHDCRKVKKVINGSYEQLLSEIVK